jgi:hypothetical protein
MDDDLADLSEPTHLQVQYSSIDNTSRSKDQ